MSPMNEQEAREATVTLDEARIEIEAHGMDLSDFLEDEGILLTTVEVSGALVLNWLGY